MACTLHLDTDRPPHVPADDISLRLLGPDDGWRRRADRDSQFTRPFRASIVALARFIKDLVEEQAWKRARLIEPGVGVPD